MDASKLATKMLEWENLQSQANALAAEIEATMLELGKTQTVGNVRAAYSKGRQTQEDGAKYSLRIFSGDYSVRMWDGINNSKTVEDLRWALYCVCCRLQELESKLAPLFELQENNLDSKEID